MVSSSYARKTVNMIPRIVHIRTLLTEYQVEYMYILSGLISHDKIHDFEENWLMQHSLYNQQFLFHDLVVEKLKLECIE